MLKEERYKSFIKDLNINDKYNDNKYYCILGDNHVFITLNNYNNKYVIELGNINNKLVFENELFLVSNSNDILTKNMQFVIQKGYKNYYYSSLILNI